MTDPTRPAPASGDDLSHPAEGDDVVGADPGADTEANSGDADSGDQSLERRVLIDSPYFSPETRRIAREIAEVDDEELVGMLGRELHDRDTSALREILGEFHRMQAAIHALSADPSDRTYSQFQVAIERFLGFARRYIYTPESSGGDTADETAPRADTGIERTALGMRLKLLAQELKEMLRTIPHMTRESLAALRKKPWKQVRQNPAFIRPSLAQRSTAQLFGVERQVEVRRYLEQVQELLGPHGLRYVSKPREWARKAKEIVDVPRQAVVNRVANIRNNVLRLITAALVVVGSGYVAKKTYNVAMSFRSHAGDSSRPGAPEPPPSPPADNGARHERDEAAEKVLQLFAGMNAVVQGNVLRVTFTDLQGFTVNRDVYVCVGTDTTLNPKEMRAERGTYTYKLEPSEASQREVVVGLRVNVGNNRWLAPKGIVNGRTLYKTIPITQ